MRGVPRWLWSREAGENAPLTTEPTEIAPDAGSAGRLRLHLPISLRWAVVALGLVCFVALSFPLTREMSSSGTVRDTAVLPLGTGAPVPGAHNTRSIISDVYGYVILPHSTGRVDVPLRFAPLDGKRTLLRLWAAGAPGSSTYVWLISGHGHHHLLGVANHWNARQFDVTRYLSPLSTSPRATLQVLASNHTGVATLVLDQIAQTQASKAVAITAPGWAVALWIALAVATVLLAAGWLRRHWLLVAVSAAAVYLLWHEVPGMSLTPLEAQTELLWRAAQQADWLSFHHGLWWGSWTGLSSLSVQLFHAMTPLVGKGDAGARGAGALLGVFAVLAIYAAGNRVAGRRGALAASICALAIDPFRMQASLGLPVGVLALSGALFVSALHAFLTVRRTTQMALLAGAGALMCLADPIWIPGIVLALIVVAVAYAGPGRRMRLLGVGLLVLGVLMLPNRASTADQGKGDPFADVNTMVRYARNLEFAGRGYGAPAPAAVDADPLHAGRSVALGTYLFVDHSLPVAVGGALSGTHKLFSVLTQRERSGAFGVIAFVLAVAGGLYLLLIPRLRMLVLIPWLVSAPGLFLASKGAADPLAAGMGLWPALLVGGGVLVYALCRLLEERVHVPGLTRAWASLRHALTAVPKAAPTPSSQPSREKQLDGDLSGEQTRAKRAQDVPVA
jgi:hypothetical protein